MNENITAAADYIKSVAGGALDLPVRQRNRGLARADSGYVVGVMCQQTNVAVNHACANTLNLAVKEQAVRSADF